MKWIRSKHKSSEQGYNEILQSPPFDYVTIPGYLPDRNRWVCWLYQNKIWEHMPGYESNLLILFQVREKDDEWRDLGNDIGFYFKALAMAFITNLPFYAYLVSPSFEDKLKICVRWMPTAVTELFQHPYFKDVSRRPKFSYDMCSNLLTELPGHGTSSSQRL